MGPTPTRTNDRAVADDPRVEENRREQQAGQKGKRAFDPEGAAREPIGTLEPAKTKKNVVVIGGGPAGMEAARVARLRGHKVVLYEKDAGMG